MTLMKSKIRLFLIIAAVALAISFIFYIPGTSAKRRIFTFPEIGTEKTVVEVRYLRTPEGMDEVTAFVNELLLGPQTSRVRPLFTRGTNCSFCFVRDKTLYVDLSANALLEASDSASILEGIRYFKQNIKKNFPSVREIQLYIGGRPVE
ncbi:MAG: GerMN domain-containing protein [Treponema sp.]|nr:GerMN domain-containing protein [Treponema sp.]